MINLLKVPAGLCAKVITVVSSNRTDSTKPFNRYIDLARIILTFRPLLSRANGRTIRIVPFAKFKRREQWCGVDDGYLPRMWPERTVQSAQASKSIWPPALWPCSLTRAPGTAMPSLTPPHKIWKKIHNLEIYSL